MRMEKPHHSSEVKWHKPLPPRNWNNVSMIPSISRPSSRISRIGSFPRNLHDGDWMSSGSLSSRSSSIFDSPTIYGYHRSRPKRQVKIEDLLTKHSSLRPRSISLAKYEPLPSIGKDSPRKSSQEVEPKRASSVGSLAKENHELSHVVEQTRSDEGPLSNIEAQGMSMESVEFSPEEPDAESSITNDRPKLLRSRTFDVIETNLTNLPVIDEPTNHSSSDVEGMDEPTQAFIDENLFYNFAAKQISRPSSHSSLITHPGTPDSGFVAHSAPMSVNSAELFSGDYLEPDENYDLESSESYVKPIFHSFPSAIPDDTLSLEVSDIP